jgi:pimeloyl-ACP methyl ester carboxylesterase
MEGRWTVVAGRPMHAWLSRQAAACVPLAVSPRALPRLVLVHGLGKAGESLVELGDELDRRGLAAWAPDLPGFGESSRHPPPRPLDIAGLAAALDRWLEAEALRPAVLVGNSNGAQVVAHLAARRPEAAAGVVLVGPTTDRTGRSVLAQAWRWVLNSRHDRSAGSGILRAYWRAGIGRLARSFQYAVRDRIEDKLPHIAAPALVIAGALDPIVPVAWAREVCDLLPDGRLVVLEGAGHSMHGNQPDQVADAIVTFVEERLQAASVIPVEDR